MEFLNVSGSPLLVPYRRRALRGPDDSQAECQAAGGCWTGFGVPASVFYCVTPDYCESQGGSWESLSRTCTWADGSQTSCGFLGPSGGNNGGDGSHWYDDVWRALQDFFGGGTKPPTTTVPPRTGAGTPPVKSTVNLTTILLIGGVGLIAIMVISGMSGGKRRRNPRKKRRPNQALGLEAFVYPALYNIAAEEETAEHGKKKKGKSENGDWAA